ncbi:MAG: helix-turn-helix transcriptional regulator [Wenzhouxiangellaceae bacterium]
MSNKTANRVREFREQNNRMTQQALAEQVGVSRQTIIAIETGRYQPSLEVALKIATAFATSVESLFWLVQE